MEINNIVIILSVFWAVIILLGLLQQLIDRRHKSLDNTTEVPEDATTTTDDEYEDFLDEGKGTYLYAVGDIDIRYTEDEIIIVGTKKILRHANLLDLVIITNSKNDFGRDNLTTRLVTVPGLGSIYCLWNQYSEVKLEVSTKKKYKSVVAGDNTITIKL